MNQRIISIFLCCFTSLSTSFTFSRRAHLPWGRARLQSFSNDKESDVKQPAVLGVVAPLKYMGPYPCLSLRFPDLATTDQRDRNNLTGTSLDFVLDTGANVNSIDTRLVQDLALPQLPLLLGSEGIAALGSGGPTQAGELYLLGDCQLGGLPPGQDFTFMTNLTAVSLPHPSPVGQGLLGLTFFLSFPAGVEVDWYGTDGDPPTIIFYFAEELRNDVVKNLTRIPLERLPFQVMLLTINVNGTEMPALLDTGSPITVLNQTAAQQAGIEAVPISNDTIFPAPKRQQAIGDEVLTVGGVERGRVPLKRSKSTEVPIRVGNVSLGRGPVYVGDLPMFAFLDGLGISSLPAAVLGLDSLRRTYRMILRATENEMWLEELKDQEIFRGPTDGDSQ